MVGTAPGAGALSSPLQPLGFVGVWMPVTVVVLAAGQGKRMHSDLPKVLQPLAGTAAARARARRRHERSRRPRSTSSTVMAATRVRAAFPDETDLRWTLQAEQLGTGHAVMQALPSDSRRSQVLVLLGDVPLVGARTLQRLVAGSENESRAARPRSSTILRATAA